MNRATPLSKEIIARVEDKILQVYLLAQTLWSQTFELPGVDFSCRGVCAGRAYGRQNRISLNPILLVENQEDFIEQTIPHEIAHLLTDQLHGFSTRSHGPEWKSVMRALGLEPTRCHDYDVSSAQVRRERRFIYACKCRTIERAARVHNRLQRPPNYLKCLRCKTNFFFQGPATPNHHK